MIVSLLNWENTYISTVEKFIGEKIVECHSRQEAIEVLPKAEIIITIGGVDMLFDEEMLEVCGNLRLLLSLSAGIEKLPLQALHSRGIAVCNTKGAHGVTISEYVLGGMLAVSHRYPPFIRNQGNSLWQPVFKGEDIEGQTLCIIGAGSIGKEIGKRAKAFEMEVIGLKRNPGPMKYFDQVWGIERLQEALGLADYAVLVTPLTQETRHLMGAEEFRIMKDTAVFINVSRGDTVDEEALVLALQGKQIAGAILDVFHIEPLPADSPLWKMENVLVTPHNAGLSDNSESKMLQLICDNIIRYRKGRKLINQIKENYSY